MGVIMSMQINALSKKELEIIAWLEFYQKYFFKIEDINNFFKNQTQRYNIIKNLLKKKRIIKLNRDKYYLIPIKARNGKWMEHPFVLADEIFNGENYFIGGWSAANYYRLTEQIPFWIEVFTTKRQGRKIIMNTKFIFRRTTKKRIKLSIVKNVEKHNFRIMNLKEMKIWMKSK